MKTQKQESEGFPVFRSYFWSGPSVDQIFAEADAAKSSGEVESVLDYLEQDHVAAALAKVEIKPTTSKVSLRFAADDRPSLPIELANMKLTPRGILAFVRNNGVLGCDILPDYARHVHFLRHTLLALSFKQRNVDAQRDFVRTIINEHLAESAPALDSQLRLTTRSSRLIDAIWLQVAKMIESGRYVGICDRCMTFFEVSKGASRTDRSYCGNTCKVAAYRDRKRAAFSLHARGATYLEIAKELGSEVETVKGWISEKGD